MSSSKKIDLKRDFAAGVYLSEAQDPVRPPHTQCIRVYSILIQQGKGEGGEKGREATVHKAASKYHHD